MARDIYSPPASRAFRNPSTLLCVLLDDRQTITGRVDERVHGSPWHVVHWRSADVKSVRCKGERVLLPGEWWRGASLREGEVQRRRVTWPEGWDVTVGRNRTCDDIRQRAGRSATLTLGEWPLSARSLLMPM
eukprot:915490-Rhodomonas_salina.1